MIKEGCYPNDAQVDQNVQCELTVLDTPFLMFARKEESAQKPSCDRTLISQFFMSDAEQIIK